MRNEEHLIIGAIVGGLLGLVFGNVESFEGILNVIIAAFFGGVGATIPDSLEPATSRWHRRYYHSQGVLKKLTIALLIFLILYPIWITDPIGYVILGTITGYISHLLADVTTPMRLPR